MEDEGMEWDTIFESDDEESIKDTRKHKKEYEKLKNRLNKKRTCSAFFNKIE